MKITKSRLKQIIKEELDLATKGRYADDDVGGYEVGQHEEEFVDDDEDRELTAILDEPLMEEMLMEIDPFAGGSDPVSTVQTGMYIGLGIVLAYAGINAVGGVSALALELLDVLTTRRQERKYKKEAAQQEERQVGLLDQLISDPEFAALMEEYSDLAAYLPTQKGVRSKELQGQRKRLRDLASNLRQEIQKKAEEIQGTSGGYVPRPHLPQTTQHFKKSRNKNKV